MLRTQLQLTARIGRNSLQSTRSGFERCQMSATDLFVSMWRTWRESVPPSLVDEDPGLLLDLLGHASLEGGTIQRTLLDKLGIRQGRLSKLMIKLRSEGWIEDFVEEGGDGRVRRIRQTAACRILIASVTARLGELGVKPIPASTKHSSKRKGLTPVAAGTYTNIYSL